MKITRTVLAALLFLVSPGINSYEAMAQVNMSLRPRPISNNYWEQANRIQVPKSLPLKMYNPAPARVAPIRMTQSAVKSKAISPSAPTAPVEASLSGMEKSLEEKHKTVSNSVSTDADASGATRDMAEILQGGEPSAGQGTVAVDEKYSEKAPAVTLKASSKTNFKTSAKTALAVGGILLAATQASAAETTATTVATLASQGFAWASANIVPVTNDALIGAAGVFATAMVMNRLKSKLKRMARHLRYRPDDKTLAIELISLAAGGIIFSAAAKLVGAPVGETLATGSAGAIAMAYATSYLTKIGALSSDLKAGLGMALTPPFETGDKIRVKSPDGAILEGRVKEITLFDTKLTVVAANGEKTTVIIVNSHIASLKSWELVKKWHEFKRRDKNKQKKSLAGLSRSSALPAAAAMTMLLSQSASASSGAMAAAGTGAAAGLVIGALAGLTAAFGLQDLKSVLKDMFRPAGGSPLSRASFVISWLIALGSGALGATIFGLVAALLKS